MKPEWKQDEKGAWSLEVTIQLDIVVTRSVYYPSHVWTLRCDRFGIVNKMLESKDVEVAKREAIEYVRTYVKLFYDALGEL